MILSEAGREASIINPFDDLRFQIRMHSRSLNLCSRSRASDVMAFSAVRRAMVSVTRVRGMN